MAIFITKRYSSKEECLKEKEAFHNALVGSPAYVNNEIGLISEGDLEFTLCVGENRGVDDLYLVSKD